MLTTVPLRGAEFWKNSLGGKLRYEVYSSIQVQTQLLQFEWCYITFVGLKCTAVSVKYNLINCILTHYGIFIWMCECRIILPVIYEWIVTSGFVVWYGLWNISLGEVSSFNLSSGAIIPKYAMSSYTWFYKRFSMLMLKME